MENSYNIEDFLAKWASGELVGAEKEAFEKSEDHNLYRSILEGTDVLEVPAYDREALFKKIQENKAKEKKVVQLIPKWVYAAAAAIALLIVSTLFFNQTETYATGFGEQLAVALPDGSEAILNAKSTLEFKQEKWEEHRNLSLEGEAFFKVKKGKTFTVQTSNGSVTVLGTQFSVNTNTQLLEVICFEGRVQVTKGTGSKIITKGQAVRILDSDFESWSLNAVAPDWLQEESSFNNAPLFQVIKALENQFDVVIDGDAIDTQKRFTGSFTHSNIEKALRTVFEPMEIKFTFKNENTIILVKE